MIAPPGRPLSPRPALIVRCAVSAVLITAGAIVIALCAALTAGTARRLYAGLATRLARVLLRLWHIRMEVIAPRGWPAGQVVYISNHPSTLDLFLLVALGLPNTRFFLSGFLKKYVPLGVIAWLMGTFFTVPQDRPAERTRIFQRAGEVLRRTGESVYASPEGQRVITGAIGHFNKGAFHLATSLGVPIVPLYFDVPASVTPGKGFDARPGTVRIHVLAPIDTSCWRVEDVPRHRDDVRDLFVAWHRTLRESA